MRTLAIGLLGFLLAHGNAAAQTTQEQERILRAFQQNVAEVAEQPYGFGVIPGAQTAPMPRIFTLPVATVFRQVITRALDESVHATHMTGVGLELPLAHHPAVLELFPATELHEFPALLARALPPLPRRIEYRLIGNDLVLRDVDGDVIVAVLRDAVGRVATARH